MPRQPRIDAPGQFHHVMNRGVGGRPIFERQDDYRFFKLLLACAVRAGRIRLHAFSLMTNHYHLIVESRDGHIGETMRRIQALYAGRFNRTRNDVRPGHLFGARFKSFPIRDDSYLFASVGYTDFNPVKAGLCNTPWEYPHGSAHLLLLATRQPPWLCSATMERLLAPDLVAGVDRVSAYASLYAGSAGLDAMSVVSACLDRAPPATPVDLDGLLGGPASYARAWLERQALHGDGTPVSAPIAHASSVRAAVHAARAVVRGVPLGPGSRLSSWDVLEVGLLRDLAGLGYVRVGALLEISSSTAARRYERHGLALREEENYARTASHAAKDALERCYGTRAAAIARRVVRGRVSPKREESS